MSKSPLNLEKMSIPALKLLLIGEVVSAYSELFQDMDKKEMIELIKKFLKRKEGK